jgi:hypothetical protein
MCKVKVLYFLFLWLCLLAGVLQAEDPGNWYLISEAELRSIEQYKEKSEAERQSWLSQAQGLRKKAENSELRAARLEAESGNLNAQLAQARERNLRLEQSFNEYEAENLTLISSKNGEIAALEQAKAKETLRAAKAEDKARIRMIIIICLIGAWAVFIVFQAKRKIWP